MADKDKKVNLKEEASKEMQAFVEQHNVLVKEIGQTQGRLQELKSKIVEQSGYIKALEDVEKQ